MSTTQGGYTPLVDAAWCGKWDVVIELLDNGAHVNAQTHVSPINTVVVYTQLRKGNNNYYVSETPTGDLGAYAPPLPPRKFYDI